MSGFERILGSEPRIRMNSLSLLKELIVVRTFYEWQLMVNDLDLLRDPAFL